MKRALLTLGLCFITLITGYQLGLVFPQYSQLFMFWAGMCYLGGLQLIQPAEYKLNPMLRSSIPRRCYVLLTPHDTMVVSPDPDDIKRSIDISKGVI